MFGLPLTYAYATLRQSVAGNSTFRGIVFCTPKTVISNFVTSRQIKTPYLSPYGYPNNVPSGQKIMVEDTKKVLFKNVLIPWYPISYLTIASSGFFLGAYGSLPDAAIWWCLRTGGGGILTRYGVGVLRVR
jgi:hypothetical protein